MKILLVSEDVPIPHIGSFGKQAVLLGNALIEAGHEVKMLSCLRAPGVDTDNGFLDKLHTGINLSDTGLKGFALGVSSPARKLLMAWRVWIATLRLEDVRGCLPEILDVYSALSTPSMGQD